MDEGEVRQKFEDAYKKYFSERNEFGRNEDPPLRIFDKEIFGAKHFSQGPALTYKVKWLYKVPTKFDNDLLEGRNARPPQRQSQ